MSGITTLPELGLSKPESSIGITKPENINKNRLKVCKVKFLFAQRLLFLTPQDMTEVM